MLLLTQSFGLLAACCSLIADAMPLAETRWRAVGVSPPCRSAAVRFQLKTRIVVLEHDLAKKSLNQPLDESYPVKAEESRRLKEQERSGKPRPHGSHCDQRSF